MNTFIFFVVLTIAIVIIPYLVFLIASITDIFKSGQTPGTKILWLLAVIFLGPILGAGILIYFIARKKFKWMIAMLVYYFAILALIIGLTAFSSYSLKQANTGYTVPIIPESQNNSGTSSNKSNNIYDADEDGLTDLEEIIYMTDKNNPDTDGDGHSDKEEIQRGFNPNGSGSLEYSYEQLLPDGSLFYDIEFTTKYPKGWIIERWEPNDMFIIAEITDPNRDDLSITVKRFPITADQDFAGWFDDTFGYDPNDMTPGDKNLKTPTQINIANIKGFTNYHSVWKTLYYAVQNPDKTAAYTFFIDKVELNDPSLEMVAQILNSIKFR